MSKTTAYIIAEKIHAQCFRWRDEGVKWHATDIMPIIENYIFDSSKMQDMGGMVESCAKQVIAEFGEWMKKSTKGAKVDCTYAAPIQMLLDSATAHLIIKLEKEVIDSKRYLDGFAMAEKECIELRSKLASLSEHNAVIQSQIDNADVNLDQVKSAIKYNHGLEIAAKDEDIEELKREIHDLKGDARVCDELESKLAASEAINEKIMTALALAETALRTSLQSHYLYAQIVDDSPPPEHRAMLHLCENTLAAIAALKPVAEDSSDTPYEAGRAIARNLMTHLAPEEKAPAAGPIPAAAQMPCCPRCGKSDRVETWESYAKQHDYDAVRKDGYTHICPCYCEFAFGECDCQFFTPQPEGGEPCATEARNPCGSDPTRDADDCDMCGGGYCATHFSDPCDCDTADRHIYRNTVASNAAPEQVAPAAATAMAFLSSAVLESDCSICKGVGYFDTGNTIQTCFNCNPEAGIQSVIDSEESGQDELAELRRDRERLEMCEDLIWYTDIHYGYDQSGYMQMTTEQKSAWDEIIIRKRTEANAINNAMKGI